MVENNRRHPRYDILSDADSFTSLKFDYIQGFNVLKGARLCVSN